MLTNKTRVLLILPQDVLDGARVLAGKATTTFKLPVSLQIVLRALVEEGIADGSVVACSPKLVIFAAMGMAN